MSVVETKTYSDVVKVSVDEPDVKVSVAEPDVKVSVVEPDANHKKELTIDDLDESHFSNISICIPRVYKNITWKRIKDIFIKLNWGFIKRIDIVPIKSTNKNTFNKAFIHINNWNIQYKHILLHIINGLSVKITYDKPWFWIIHISKHTEMKHKNIKDKSSETLKTDKKTIKNKPYNDSQVIKRMRYLEQSNKKLIETVNKLLKESSNNNSSDCVSIEDNKKE
jgi:hypothetical protein